MSPVIVYKLLQAVSKSPLNTSHIRSTNVITWKRQS